MHIPIIIIGVFAGGGGVGTAPPGGLCLRKKLCPEKIKIS